MKWKKVKNVINYYETLYKIYIYSDTKQWNINEVQYEINLIQDE